MVANPAGRRHLPSAAALIVAALVGCAAPAEQSPPPTNQPVRNIDPDVVRIVTDREMTLALREPPRPLSAVVTRRDGRVDTLAVTVGTVTDTSVARLIDGTLVPGRVGRTALALVIAGRDVSANVTVEDRIANDSVAIAPGEVLAWELKPGWYEIAVHRADTTGVSPLELAAPLTCAPNSFDPDAISCLVREPTRIVLKHSGRGGRTRAHIAIVQVR